MLVGVSVCLRSHHIHFKNADGRIISDFSDYGDQTGTDTLIKRILEAAEKSQCAELKIGMEATDKFSLHIAHSLQNQLKGCEPSIDTKI